MPNNKLKNYKTLEYPITRNYSPLIPLQIINGLNNESRDIIAILDTGFTGFLQIPLSIGIGCNLHLFGIRPARLADGRIIDNLECIGKVKINEKELFGTISLSSSGTESLLGMQFLEKLGGEFIISMKDRKAILKFNA